MTALTEGTDYFVFQGLPNTGIKTLIVSTVSSADTDDTLTVDLSTYGATAMLGIIGFTHTTLNSVVVQEQPTTAISGTTLTVTIGGTAATDQARHYMIFLASKANP